MTTGSDPPFRSSSTRSIRCWPCPLEHPAETMAMEARIVRPTDRSLTSPDRRSGRCASPAPTKASGRVLSQVLRRITPRSRIDDGLEGPPPEKQDFLYQAAAGPLLSYDSVNTNRRLLSGRSSPDDRPWGFGVWRRRRPLSSGGRSRRSVTRPSGWRAPECLTGGNETSGGPACHTGHPAGQMRRDKASSPLSYRRPSTPPLA
jgi:hypothetical protein